MEDKNEKIKIKTAYNRITAYYHSGRLELRSGDGALQSVIDLRHPHRLKLKNLEYLMAVLLFIPAPERILMLGTAAGSLLHFLRYYFPQAGITAVDIDVELIERMLQLEVLPPASDGLHYIYDDAAHFLANHNQSYDLILVDIFHGAQSPTWLLEKIVTENLYRLLSAQGGLAYNLIIGSEHQFKLFYRDLRLVFSGQTLRLPVNGFENTLAYGMRYVVPMREMTWYLQHAAEQSERFGIDFMRVLSVIYNTNPVGRGVI